MKPHTHIDLLRTPEGLRSSCGYKRKGISMFQNSKTWGLKSNQFSFRESSSPVGPYPHTGPRARAPYSF